MMAQSVHTKFKPGLLCSGWKIKGNGKLGLEDIQALLLNIDQQE